VLTQFTGPPEFDTAEEPSGPHGMPTAGRVSKPFGDVVDVVDVGGAECGTVVCGAVVCAGAVVVTFGTGLVVVGNVVTGNVVIGALTTGRGPTTGGGGGGGGGAMNAGGAVDNAGTAAVGSDEVVSTLVGVSLD
jgi:hypothetical protein